MHGMARLLGIDVGTSGCKAVVIDETGRVLAEAGQTYPSFAPRPTWSEQNPQAWWPAVQVCILAVRKTLYEMWAAGDQANTWAPITAIGLTGQMHGAVFLDENGEVIRPAILWNDQRTTEECEDIDRIVGAQRVREITLNPPLTGFQLPKILWLRKHEPENFARVHKVLLPKDYIRYRLTGEFATEMSDASGTGIFDVGARRWSSEMMEALELDPSIFPKCVESVAQTGEALSIQGSASQSPEPRATPVFGGAGDQAAGAVGVGAVREGLINVSLGTSGVVFASISDTPSFEADSIHTFCHANGKWHEMGVMLACGGALFWYAASVRHLSVEEVLAEAETAEPGCGGLTFLPYLSGERSPHNDPTARAGFVGLTLSHSTKEMSRAVVEGVTFGLRDCFEAMGAISAIENEGLHGPLSQVTPSSPSHPSPLSHLSHSSASVRVTGGGAKSRFWVQMIADVFDCPVQTLQADEGPAFGAALIAGVGAGVWPDLQTACDACVRTAERFEPSGVEYQESYRRYRALYPHIRAWLNPSRTT